MPENIEKIKENIHIPLVADIHFDYKLAIAAIERGVDKIRLNPGNIGSEERVKAVVECAKKRNVPIRIGVNSGSIEKEIRHSENGQHLICYSDDREEWFAHVLAFMEKEQE